MQSIKKLTEELNEIFLSCAGKIIFSLFLVVLIYSSCYFLFISIYAFLAALLPAPVSVLFSFCFLFFLYAMFFVLHYGTMVLITRLERNLPSSIGYLFLGFKHKRTSATVWIFSGLLFICMTLAALPLFLNEDLSTVEAVQAFLANEQLLIKYAKYALVIFLVSFGVLFFMFSFVWIIVYDLPDVTGIKACARSFKMIKSSFFHYLGFLFYINWKSILIIAGIDTFKGLLFLFTQKGVNSFLGYLFGFLGFVAVLLFFAKTSIAIPFYYDKLNESSDK